MSRSYARGGGGGARARASGPGDETGSSESDSLSVRIGKGTSDRSPADIEYSSEGTAAIVSAFGATLSQPCRGRWCCSYLRPPPAPGPPEKHSLRAIPRGQHAPGFGTAETC